MLATILLSAALALPNPKLTPGAANPAITAANMQKTICNPHWSTKSVRPTSSYTNRMKRMQMNQYNLAGDPRDFEEDHLISLELGGHPTDPRNLWPEPWDIVVADHEAGARVKDHLENVLHKEVCSGAMSLEEAQQEIASNWIAAYERHIGELPKVNRGDALRAHVKINPSAALLCERTDQLEELTMLRPVRFDESAKGRREVLEELAGGDVAFRSEYALSIVGSLLDLLNDSLANVDEFLRIHDRSILS